MVTTLGKPTRPHLAATQSRSQGQVTGCPPHPPQHVGSRPVTELGRCMHPTHSPNQLPRTPAVASRDPPGGRKPLGRLWPRSFALFHTLFHTARYAITLPSRVRPPRPPSVRAWYPHHPALVPRAMARHGGWWGWPLLSPTRGTTKGVVVTKCRLETSWQSHYLSATRSHPTQTTCTCTTAARALPCVHAAPGARAWHVCTDGPTHPPTPNPNPNPRIFS